MIHSASWSRLDIRPVNHPFRAEVGGIFLCIGHIVFMRQEDVRDAAFMFEGLDKMFKVTRRIDEPVAVRMFDEEAIRAERLLRIKAAVRHPVFKLEREARHGVFHPQLVAVLGADRADGAGEERLVGLMGRPSSVGWL